MLRIVRDSEAIHSGRYGTIRQICHICGEIIGVFAGYPLIEILHIGDD